MEEVDISVTSRDILHGLVAEASWCPVALAIRRTLKLNPRNDSAVLVDSIDITTKKGTMKTPTKVANFILRFDGCEDINMKPFSFKLKLRKER